MKITIRLEELGFTLFSIYLFSLLPFPWWYFPVLFFVPDLSMLGYLVGPRRALVYNLVHQFKIALYQGYGATELCGAISLSYARDGIPPEGSAGKIVPTDRFKLVDPETLKEVPPGEPGELLGTCDSAVKAYWNKPEETAECFLNIDGEV